MAERIQGGLDILFREAQYARKRDRTWKTYEDLKWRAREHIEACGGDWEVYRDRVCAELADRLKPIR